MSVMSVTGQIKDYNRNFDKCEDELRVHGQQRMDDLELLEKAISTVQKQQTRLRGNVDESLQVKELMGLFIVGRNMELTLSFVEQAC